MTAFTIATWNCLADAYVTPGRYPDSPADLLDPAIRRPLVLDVIGRLSAVADLVCLQEAEADLAHDLAEIHGVDRVWWSPKQRNRPDGCVAVLAATSLWEVVDHRVHPFDDATPPTGHIVQLLDVAHERSVLTVANTHLRWAPDDDIDHIGARQAAELARLARHDAHPWVVCGDLNVDGLARPHHPVFRELTGAGLRLVEHADHTAVVAGTHQQLDHVVASRSLDGGELGDVVLTGRERLRALPDDDCPSDHFPVVVRLTPTLRD